MFLSAHALALGSGVPCAAWFLCKLISGAGLSFCCFSNSAWASLVSSSLAFLYPNSDIDAKASDSALRSFASLAAASLACAAATPELILSSVTATKSGCNLESLLSASLCFFKTGMTQH